MQTHIFHSCQSVFTLEGYFSEWVENTFTFRPEYHDICLCFHQDMKTFNRLVAGLIPVGNLNFDVSVSGTF